MSKYSIHQKLEAVTMFQNSSESVYGIATSLNIPVTMVQVWIKQFEYHGLAAFEKSYTTYTAEFKMNVLNYMNENGVSSNEAAVIFKIPSPRLIRKWKKQLEMDGYDALISKKKGRLSMKKETNKQPKTTPVEGSPEALQAEINRLRMENEYLKKLNALVQAKETSPKKTK
jgi:transposase